MLFRSFNPQNVDLSSGSVAPASTVEIMVDSGGQNITGVQVELQFDPKALASVKLLPEANATSFFGSTVSVLFNDVNTQTGRISYATAIPPGGTPKKGVGKIATLNFQKAYGAPSSTQIVFLDKTLVTVLGANQSALKATVPLNIVLSQTPQ